MRWLDSCLRPYLKIVHYYLKFFEMILKPRLNLFLDVSARHIDSLFIKKFQEMAKSLAGTSILKLTIRQNKREYQIQNLVIPVG